jgi:hypothetical protein
MNERTEPERFLVEPKTSMGLKLVAAVFAIVVTIGVLIGYSYLRQRHSGTASLSTAQKSPEAKKPPQAVVLVDEALLHGNKTVVGGTVRNISPAKLEQVSVEMELKRRKDGVVERKLINLEPALLEPGQDRRYSLELKSQDYGSARLVALRAGSESIPFTSSAGQKRPPEKLESKTIIMGKPPSKRDEFLNSPDNPARVP